MPPCRPAIQSALRDHRTQSCAIPEMADSRLRRRASRSEEGCHAMSHRLRLVVDEEVRAAGYELGLQAGYVVLVKRDGILQLVLHAEQHQRGHAQPASAVAPRMILMNSGRMSCRYSGPRAGAGGLAQHGEVRGDVLVRDRPQFEEAQNPGREALLSARKQPRSEPRGSESVLEPQVPHRLDHRPRQRGAQADVVSGGRSKGRVSVR
jgi:hypothetical protein